MKLSVIIPVYNEIATVQELYFRVRRAVPDAEVIVVDDASTDGSRDVVRELAGPGTTVILHDRNRGKGACLRSGFASVTGDIVMVQDADLEYDPSEYPKVLLPILDGRADAVYGSRFVTGDHRRVLLFWHMVGNRFLTLLSNMLTNLTLTDMETGCKAFRRDLLDRIVIEEDRFGFEPEITAKTARLKARIYEVGISYSGRTYAEGKKICWRDGVHALWCILKYNLLRR